MYVYLHTYKANTQAHILAIHLHVCNGMQQHMFDLHKVTAAGTGARRRDDLNMCVCPLQQYTHIQQFVTANSCAHAQLCALRIYTSEHKHWANLSHLVLSCTPISAISPPFHIHKHIHAHNHVYKIYINACCMNARDLFRSIITCSECHLYSQT